jgi:pimeloyl-ACP methyl ester carboxylesterase
MQTPSRIDAVDVRHLDSNPNTHAEVPMSPAKPLAMPDGIASFGYVDTTLGEIAYRELGEGPVALFLHGLPLSGEEWMPVMHDLADVRRCIAPDQLALGATRPRSDSDLSYEGQVRMLLEFLEGLGINAVDLVGNDTGGVAQIFAARYPRHVRTLTLTNCEVHDCWPNALLKRFYAGVADGSVPALLKNALAEPALAAEHLGALVYEDAAFFDADRVQRYLAPIVETEERLAMFAKLCEWRPSREQIMRAAGAQRASNVPAQVIWGTGDVVFDAEPSLQWLGENLGGLRRIVRVPRGKLFFPEEHPRVVSTLLAEFWGASAG